MCGPPEEWAEAALETVADGFDALKFDPFFATANGEHRVPERALPRETARLAYDRVAAVREAVGPDVDILIEVHGNLGTTSAIQMGRRLAELDPFFYEEPVDAMNVECMLKVARNVPIPIAAGERLYTRYGFRAYIEQQAIDILQPDLGLTGGISEGKRIATLAEVYDLHIQPHNCAGPISTAASVQLDACITNFIIQEWFPYRGDDFLELVDEPLEPQVVDSVLTIPDRPGLGLTLNESAVAKYPHVHVE
jgi:galactonate dehydratase